MNDERVERDDLTKPVTTERVRECDECAGAGDEMQTCSLCDGYGGIAVDDGEMMECPECEGSGEALAECAYCDGSGKVEDYA